MHTVHSFLKKKYSARSDTCQYNKAAVGLNKAGRDEIDLGPPCGRSGLLCSLWSLCFWLVALWWLPTQIRQGLEAVAVTCLVL